MDRSPGDRVGRDPAAAVERAAVRRSYVIGGEDVVECGRPGVGFVGPGRLLSSIPALQVRPVRRRIQQVSAPQTARAHPLGREALHLQRVPQVGPKNIPEPHSYNALDLSIYSTQICSIYFHCKSSIVTDDHTFLIRLEICNEKIDPIVVTEDGHD